ncbi:hypothetical protein BT96DRAFT_153229 [Gymnopus androsaceus JB14]|uniref:Uncharacterized protein n=1 Tax=Gymnopus androsaceus JB14 TaxID=1447944 RepID=A0A6A4IDE5_9AGAR|nr:hypothetical protein BT96DRAFT_153229 [Gymnopus androsaceus JB14]
MDVITFQNRSGTALSSLTLHGFSSAVENEEGSLTRTIITLLSLFPAISSFRMKKCSFEIDELVRALTLVKGQPVLLPKLPYLELHCSQDMEETPPEMIPMILSR